MNHNTDLIPYNALTELVSRHDEAQAELKRIQESRDRIDLVMRNAIGKQYSVLSQSKLEVSKDITQAFWSYVIERSQIKSIMSDKRRQELDRQTGAYDLPPFTLQCVMDTLYGWTEGSKDAFEQLIVDTFKLFLPSKWDEYKTNKRYRIGPKVIIRYGISSYVTSLTERAQTMLLDLDRIFHLLDGKLSPQYPNSVDCIINMATQDRLTEVETTYFRIKWFKNQNIHLAFLRLDLLEKWNGMAGRIIGGLVGEER